MLQVVKCIYSLFGELSGNCTVVIYWSASKLLVEIKENLLLWFAKTIIDCLCYSKL